MASPIDPDFLKRSDLFENQPPEVIQAVLAQGEIQEFGAGAVVFDQGDEGDRLYIVKSGVLEVLAAPVGRRGAGARRVPRRGRGPGRAGAPDRVPAHGHRALAGAGRAVHAREGRSSWT